MSLVSNTSRTSEYDVFLSFRGEDTRTTFTAHLYSALCRKKIETYIDVVKLESGDEISPELLRAIQRSKISVVVFSKRYASSRWCLDELAQILDCKKRNGQIVVPVFYHVEPSHVRNLKGTYGTDFAELEKKYKFRMYNRVKDWRSALRLTANLSGFNWKNARTEADLVEDVARDILKKLNKFSFENIDGDMVGINQRIQDIKAILSRGTQDINVIGIWGMGGIGKTTLARTIFNQLCIEFNSSCFLENVREGLEKHGIEHLKSTLLTEILDEGNSSIRPTSSSSKFDSARVFRNRVLIVLDDVNVPYHVNDLVGNQMSRFGKGSIIILTSRNKQVLRTETIEENIYEVVALNDDEAMRLFQMKAFRRNTCSSDDYKELSRRVIRYASGIPLALQVLGSLLRGRSLKEWESALDKLKKFPEKEIQRVLQISYDYLDLEEKQIFLDIACFLKGWDIDRVQDILDGCGFSTLIGIRNLINKSLVTVNNNNKLEMHDLIQDMGKGVERDESVRLGCSRRLWNDEVWSILRDSTATKEVVGLFYNGKSNEGSHHICQRRPVDSESFSKMFRLRLLKVSYKCFSCEGYVDRCQCELYLSNGLQSLPSAPCFFYWEEYPSNSLPSNFIIENLVELHFPNSKIERLWDGVQNLPRLKVIDGSFSEKLIEIPNLSQAPNLLKIDLNCCNRLRTLSEVPRNIEDLGLEHTAIHKLPSSIEHANKMKFLNLNRCTNLKKFSKLPKNITELCLKHTSMKVLPTTIEELSVLEKLDLSNCNLLKCLLAGIYKLKSLKELNLSGCSKLRTFPDILEPMKHLTKLDLSRMEIEYLPSWFYKLNNVQVLKLSGCSKLKKLPLLPINLSELDVSGCESIQSLPKLPIFLHRLDATACPSLEVVSSFRNLGLQDWLDQCIVGLDERKLSTREELYFCNCLKLDKNACNYIIAKSELRILRMTSLLLDYGASRTYEHITWLPGSDFPQWFDYQIEHSSIWVEFPSTQDKTGLLGFVIGIVVEFEQYDALGPLVFELENYFISKNKEAYEIKSTFQIRSSESRKQQVVNSDHIFICYDHLLHHPRRPHNAFPFFDLNHAYFCVRPDYSSNIGCFNVKKLGIRLLYAGKAEELGFIGNDIERDGDNQNSSENVTEVHWSSILTKG